MPVPTMLQTQKNSSGKVVNVYVKNDSIVYFFFLFFLVVLVCVRCIEGITGRQPAFPLLPKKYITGIFITVEQNLQIFVQI